MGIGRTYQNEQHRQTDRVSGRDILRLTNYLGHSYQFYFTHPCWLNEGRTFIFNSERENQSNYFRCDLSTGLITQLTDFSSPKEAKGCLSPETNCLYYWTDSGLYERNLLSLTERLVCEVPQPLIPTGLTAMADGQSVCVLLVDCQVPECLVQPPRISGQHAAALIGLEEPFVQPQGLGPPDIGNGIEGVY